MMMEQQQKHGSVSCDRLPSPSAKYPWLVVQNAEDNFSDQIFYNLHNPLSQYRYQIPELVGRRIQGFFHGWVILSNNVMWSLWNPSTSMFIRLPPLNILKNGDSDDIISECCLTSPPDDPGSILVLTRTDKSTFVFCRLDCKRKRLRWTEMSYTKQLKRITGDGCLLHSLACCNGKVYALNNDGSLFPAIIIIDIVVKDKEVVIKLLLFGKTPYTMIDYYSDGRNEKCFLKGSPTVLFYVVVGFIEFTEKTIRAVNVFELDTTTIDWEEIHRMVNKRWDMTDMSELDDTDINKLRITFLLWEEISDLKDAIFFLDLALDYSVFYLPGIASELAGCIHIRGKTGKIIHSYHVKDKTLSRSYMPSPVLSTSHVSLWEEKGLKGDYADYKQEEENKDDEIVIRSVTDDEVEFNESHLLNLSTHFLEMIMEHCAGVEYMKFRATCKRCHLAAPLIRWKDKSGLTRLQNYSLVSPWLMVIDEEQGIITFRDPLFGDKYYMKNSQELIFDKRIFCSRFGWLLLFYTNSTPVFYNPFTSDIRKLPPTDYHWADSFSFSAPPTSPDCMVVGFSRHNDWNVQIHSVSREFSWHRIHLGYVCARADRYFFRYPTFYGQDLYALHEDELHFFKNWGVDDYSWEQVVVKPPKSCSASPAKHFLTRLDQHLILVIVFEEYVEVFKLNDGAKTWGKIDGLGRHMIYVCDETCLCIEAKTPEMRNKIYFPELHSKNGRVVFYSLETCMYGIFNCKTIQATQTIAHQLHSIHTWIEPNWS